MPNKIKTLRPPWASLAAAGKPQRDESKRPTAAERGYCSKAHRAWRQAVLTASAWQCRECGKVCAGEREAHADHIIPIADGGERYDVANGQCLCIRCHGRKTRRENARPPAGEGGQLGMQGSG